MTLLPYWKKHPSGLETLLVEKHDSPIVKINIIFPFGSYEDPKGKEGLLNFTGDMLLRGTTKKSRTEVEFALDHLGASMNVFIGYHSLVVEGRVLTKNLHRFLELMKEILTSPSFNQAEVLKLKNEIKADLLLRLEDDQDLAKHHFTKELFENHLYSRDVIGNPKSIDSISTSELPETYLTYLNQSGMLVGASGDLTPAQFEETAHQIYAFFPKNKQLPTRHPFQSKSQGIEITLIDKPELTQTQFFIGHSSISSTNEDLIALDIFSTAFAGSMFQAKYMQEIRVKRGWSYGAYGSIDARRDGGAFYLFTFPKNEDTIDAISLSLELFDQAVNGSLVDEKAFKFAQNYMTRSYPFKIDTPDKILSQKVYNKLSGRPEDALETFRSRVQAVDYQKVLEVARKHLRPKDVKIVMVCTADLFKEKLQERLSPKTIKIKKYTDLD
jgi:zinc protease